MPIIKQSKIDLNDLNENPNVFFVYMENAKKTGGDFITKMLRDKDNTLPVTLKKSGGTELDSYWIDKDLDFVQETLDNDLRAIEEILLNRGVVVFPLQMFNTEHFVEEKFSQAGKRLFNDFVVKLEMLMIRYLPKNRSRVL